MQLPRPLNFSPVLIGGDFAMGPNIYNVVYAVIAAPSTLTLPSIATVINGFPVFVKNFGPATLTVVTADLVDTYTLPDDTTLMLIADSDLDTWRPVLGPIKSTASPVSGPGVSTDNAIALWSGTTGDTLKNSNLTVIGNSLNTVSGSLRIDSFTGNIGILTSIPSSVIGIDGTAARVVQVERNTAGSGNALTLGAGGAATAATNGNGGDLILKPGISTGVGRSHVRTQGFPIGSAGTTDNAVLDRIVTGEISLTNASPISIADVLVAANGQTASGTISYSIQVTNGTNAQTECGIIHYSVALAGGVYTTQIVKTPGCAVATIGSLVTAWSITTTPATKFTVQTTATSAGLASPVLSMYYTIQNNSSVGMTVL